MDSELKNELCSSLNNSEDVSIVEMKVISNNTEESGSVTLHENKLESLELCHKVGGCSSDPVHCDADNGQNTQVMSEDEHVKEIGKRNIHPANFTTNKFETVDSNINEEVHLENTEILEIQSMKGKRDKNASRVQEKALEKQGISEKSKLDFYEKMDVNLLDESDEVKEVMVENDTIDPKIEGNAHEETRGQEITGENMSQATTMDITDTDDNNPDSPEDLFASQSLEVAVKQNSENSLIDYEDFIPSSLPSQSEKCEKEAVANVENASVSTPQKRKIEEIEDNCNSVKVPRLEVPLVTSQKSTLDDKGKKTNEEGEDIEIIDDSIIGEVSDSREEIILDKNIRFACEKKEAIIDIDKDVKDNKSVGAKERESEHSSESEKGTMSSKDSRKSVEVIFSSFENYEKGSLDKMSPKLSFIQEENGEEDEEASQSLHLRLSLSPSQLTQSFSDTDLSKCSENVHSKMTVTENSSNGDTSNFKDKLNYSHEVNSHSSDEVSKKLPDTVTVDDNSDVQITSPDNRMSISNDIVVLKTVENGSAAKHDTDSDVTVILEKSEGSDKSFSGIARHKDMNGTLEKRKHPETDEDAVKHDLHKAEGVETIPEADTYKHPQLADTSSEDKNTPSLPQLLSNKGKYQSTPIDNSRVTPTNESSLRVVNCTFALQVRLHVNDDLRQVHSIELVQCQKSEDSKFMYAIHQEGSGGSTADESKNSSPSSVMSLGPFSLKTQSWRLSSGSTSTTSSGHSHLGTGSKSEDWAFPAPLKPAPIRNNKLRNIQYSFEFERDLFELAERTVFVDGADSKSSSLIVKTAASLVSTCAPPVSKELDGINDLPSNKVDTQEHVETPKSSKKLSQGNRSTRSSGRALGAKLLKDITEEALPRSNQEKEASSTGESSGSQRKPRKAASRSSKRTGGSTTSTPVPAEEMKMGTPTAPSSGRLRRNRGDTTQVEKTDSSSQDSSSHIYDWATDVCFSKLVPEASVFARWTDKKYYPGKIKEKTKDGRWVIEFDDKTVRPLKEEFIIPINFLTKGQIVFAYDSDEYEQGIIVEFKVKDGEVQYGVDLDSGRKLFVPRSRLFMSEDQARLLQENLDPKSPATTSPALTTVSCDNIVHHKRPRSTRVLFGGSASPGVSGVVKTSKRPSHDNSCSSSVSDSNDKGPTLVLDEVGGVDPEVPSSFPELLHAPSGRGKGPGRIKSKTRTPRRNASANHALADTQEYNKLQEELGPVPIKGSKMFSGKCFIITHSGAKPVFTKINTSFKSSKKSECTSSSEYEEAFSDEGMESKIPLVKEHLKQQLEAGGGVVYENFEDVPEDQYQNCLLITDRPSLTAKYIVCLANGIKIIDHRWVIEEAKGSNRPLSCARLQAGWDLEGQRFVLPDATVRTRKQKPLNKKEVGIVNDSQTFVKFWERILELLGANVRHISPGSPEQDRQFSGVDVILTDSTCPPEVQDRAREWSIPLVSTVWLTQTLIHWRIRSYVGHPHYRYDYCSSD